MEKLTLSVLESFYVGGDRRTVWSPFFGGDEITVGAMYVQHMAPEHVTFPYPVIFVHGGMHTGVTWETTPDGREGWQTLFVRGGFDTYVIDQSWRGRSAPDLSGLMRGVDPADQVPEAFYCGRKLASQFDRGGQRFPRRSIDQYAAQLWPDFAVPKAVAAGHPGLSDPLALPALVSLLDRLGAAVLITHSQGGHLGWQAALACPDRVKAILSVEPAVTSPGLDAAGFPDIPVCLMWGDHLPDIGHTLTQQDLATGRRIAAARPRVEVDYLPEADIPGNGHMLMMEDNSVSLARRAMDWFDRAVPVR